MWTPGAFRLCNFSFYSLKFRKILNLPRHINNKLIIHVASNFVQLLLWHGSTINLSGWKKRTRVIKVCAKMIADSTFYTLYVLIAAVFTVATIADGVMLLPRDSECSPAHAIFPLSHPFSESHRQACHHKSTSPFVSMNTVCFNASTLLALLFFAN